jgi:hypothetical protein
MPQIWLDDEELADFAGISPTHARIYATQQGWARMRSRSGHSRSRLPPELTQDYLRLLTQAMSVPDNATRSWARLRKALVGLMPGIRNAAYELPSHSIGNDAKSGHSIASPILISESRQSEAA